MKAYFALKNNRYIKTSKISARRTQAKMTDAPDILPFQQVDVSKITLSEPRETKTKDGVSLIGSFIRSSQFAGNIARYTVRDLETAYDLSQFKNPQGIPVNPNDWNLHLRLTGSENGLEGMPENVRMFYNFIKAIEARIKQIIKENEDKWPILPKEEMYNAMYPMIKKHKDKKTGQKYSDTVMFKIRFREGSFLTTFRDATRNNEAIQLNPLNTANEIPRGTRGLWQIQLSRVSFGSAMCSVIMDLIQASVKRPAGARAIPQIEVFDGGVEDADEEENAKETVASSAKPAKLTFNEDDDDEEEDNTKYKEAPAKQATTTTKTQKGKARATKG